MHGMGLAVGDYDLDGFLDLFMTNIGHSVLLRNEGDGLRFTNSTAEAGTGIGALGSQIRVTWGAVFFDHDNDGDEDLYVVSGYLRGYPPPGNPEEQPNVLLRNNGDETFADVSAASGTDDAGMGRGGVYLDFNNNGCLDLFVSNIGQAAMLYRNLCDTGNNWLVIKTVGTTSNRDGIGARITLSAQGSTQIREITAGSSQVGQNMMAAHFGLGTGPEVDSLSIRWPSGVVQVIEDPGVNQAITVIEPPPR